MICATLVSASCQAPTSSDQEKSSAYYQHLDPDSVNYDPKAHWHVKDSAFGYRFVLIGDFDGNKTIDTLIERYLDTLELKEKHKFYPVEDYMELQEYNHISLISDVQKQISDYPFRSNLGFAFAEVLQDINGNGRQEIGYVGSYADASSCNTYRIIEYNDISWDTVYTFEVRDWELPYLPDVNFIYGYFGVSNTGTIDQSYNREIENYIKQYRRVKIIKPKLVEFVAFYKYDHIESIELFPKFKSDTGFWFKIHPKIENPILKNEYVLLYELEESEIEEVLKDHEYFLTGGCSYVYRIEFK